MKRAAILLVIWLALPVPGQSPRPKNYQFINGSWFDGKKFIVRTFYSVQGVLSARRPKHVDEIIDLAGKFIVPPYGEAHNHNLDWTSEKQFDALKRMYLTAGVYYIKNPNSLPRAKQLLAGKINVPKSVDGVFANGGLTAWGGHPIEIVTPQRGFKPADGEGGFYFVIDNLSDLRSKWRRIMAGKPDFIKTYLLYSEEFEKRKNDQSYFAWKGLDPAMLGAIVRYAHRDGLRVSTHVETATDFHNALVAGVDEINHTPGFRPERNDFDNYRIADLKRYEISQADALLAARHRTIVVTTLGDTIDWSFDGKQPEEVRRAVRELLGHNLHLLKQSGVSIAIGSDSFRKTSAPEALSLLRLAVFDNLTLLKMWVDTTAAAIFPRRKVGHLSEGSEASFLVLTANPLADFTNTQRIERRFKQGEFLEVAP